MIKKEIAISVTFWGNYFLKFSIAADKLFKAELAEHKVELAGEIEKFLRYYDGVESFGKNIDIDIEQIESLRRGLKVDMENLMDDMKLVQKGIDMAERAAQDLGINPNSIPNYDKAKSAISYGEKQLAKGKQFK